MKLAQEGAQHFKAKQYLQAARKFEEAYRLNPSNPVFLRYSGRGWQEVGHWERAKQLLERYYQVEKDPNRKATILKHLAVLRNANGLVIAERLRFATEAYPGQGLELDAGFAFEKLGEMQCKQGKGEDGVKRLNQAKQFFEVARLSARTPGERMEISTAVKRIESKIDKCKPFCADKLDGPWCADAKTLITCVGRKAKTTQTCANRCTTKGIGQPGKCLAAITSGGTGPKGPIPTAPSSGGALKYVLGGLLFVAGGGLTGFGYVQATTANDELNRDIKKAKENKTNFTYDTYDEYEADKATATYMFYGGAAVAAVGAGVLVWAITSGDDKPAAKKTTWLLPVASDRHVGLSFGTRF